MEKQIEQLLDEMSRYKTQWNKVVAGDHPMTRRQLAERLKWSYSKTNRWITEAHKRGLVIQKWTHQHQTYWEAWYSIA